MNEQFDLRKVRDMWVCGHLAGLLMVTIHAFFTDEIDSMLFGVESEYRLRVLVRMLIEPEPMMFLTMVLLAMRHIPRYGYMLTGYLAFPVVAVFAVELGFFEKLTAIVVATFYVALTYAGDRRAGAMYWDKPSFIRVFVEGSGIFSPLLVFSFLQEIATGRGAEIEGEFNIGALYAVFLSAVTYLVLYLLIRVRFPSGRWR